jgi:hypothetical protein
MEADRPGMSLSWTKFITNFFSLGQRALVSFRADIKIK